MKIQTQNLKLKPYKTHEFSITEKSFYSLQEGRIVVDEKQFEVLKQKYLKEKNPDAACILVAYNLFGLLISEKMNF